MFIVKAISTALVWVLALGVLTSTVSEPNNEPKDIDLPEVQTRGGAIRLVNSSDEVTNRIVYRVHKVKAGDEVTLSLSIERGAGAECESARVVIKGSASNSSNLIEQQDRQSVGTPNSIFHGYQIVNRDFEFVDTGFNYSAVQRIPSFSSLSPRLWRRGGCDQIEIDRGASVRIKLTDLEDAIQIRAFQTPITPSLRSELLLPANYPLCLALNYGTRTVAVNVGGNRSVLYDFHIRKFVGIGMNRAEVLRQTSVELVEHFEKGQEVELNVQPVLSGSSDRRMVLAANALVERLNKGLSGFSGTTKAQQIRRAELGLEIVKEGKTFCE